MAKASSQDQVLGSKYELWNYIKVCNNKFVLKQSHNKPEDFTSDFYKTLELSYDAVFLYKPQMVFEEDHAALDSLKSITCTVDSTKEVHAAKHMLTLMEDRLRDFDKKVTEDKEPEDFISETLQLSYDADSSHKNKSYTEESLEDIEDSLSDLYKKVTEGKTNFNDIIALATSYCNMGILYNSYKDDEKRLRRGITHLKRSLKLLNGKELNCRAILIVMRASMQLEYICKQLKKPKKCCPFTHKAIGFYLEYTTQLSSFPMPFATLSVSLNVENSETDSETDFETDSETDSGRNTMNAMMTLYLQLLEHVQTCEFLEWDPLDLIPIHNFLMNRWTVMLDELNVLHNGLMWAENATNFYLFSLRKYRFNDARNYLAATQYILNEYEKELNAAEEAKQEDKGITMEREIYNKLRTDLDYGWAKYGNALLLHSKYKLFYNQKSRTEKDTSRSTSSIEANESAEPVTFTWENLDERIKDIAKQVTDKNLSTLRDATEIFEYTKPHFKKLKAHFQKISCRFSYALEAYNVTLMYKYLECFEPDRNIRIGMHKRRLMMLVECVASPNEYNPLNLDMCRNIIISCSAIIDLMMENVEIAEKPFTERLESEVDIYVNTCVDCFELCERFYEVKTKDEID